MLETLSNVDFTLTGWGVVFIVVVITPDTSALPARSGHVARLMAGTLLTSPTCMETAR